MAFPFEIEAENLAYHATFLQSVTVKIQYNPLGESIEAFSDFLKDYFALEITPRLYDLKNADALRLKSTSGTSKAKFTKGEIELIINAPYYANFTDTLQPFISRSQKFLTDFGCKDASVSIRNVNIWPLLNPLEGFTTNDITKIILSRSLLQTESLISESFSTWEVSDNRDNHCPTTLVVKYGWISNEQITNQAKEQLVLDLLVKSSYSFHPKQLSDFAEYINSIVWSAFSWCVAPEVVTAMQEKPTELA